MLVETWLDRENFMSEQLKRPYRAQYEARLPELLRTPRELSFYEPVIRHNRTLHWSRCSAGNLQALNQV
jgi:quinol monooxygenase YgiN